ncbi:hypothetical protein ACH49_27620 [Streptomyces leeuwenhoekii]|uniref:Uncharacterized protein n=1 Tax=Streptomyces leeuwenhoekii TaxID=1437453 RepID=A0ABR5HRD0_STRLW|nr:hypothetical protein ACH49_27620 [Streptomyces leeuwenhoekii]
MRWPAYPRPARTCRRTIAVAARVADAGAGVAARVARQVAAFLSEPPWTALGRGAHRAVPRPGQGLRATPQTATSATGSAA